MYAFLSNAITFKVKVCTPSYFEGVIYCTYVYDKLPI